MNRKANVKLHRDQDEHKINMVQHGGPGLIVTLTLQVFACDSFDGFPDAAVTKSSYFWSQKLGAKAYSPVYLMSLYVYLFYKYIV